MWPQIAPMVERSLPPMSDGMRGTLQRLLEAVLLDKAAVWVFMEGTVLKGIAVTTDLVMPITNATYLLVYAMYGTFSLENVKTGMESLRRFAYKVGAQGVVAYTADVRLAQLVRKLGGRADFVLIEF